MCRMHRYLQLIWFAVLTIRVHDALHLIILYSIYIARQSSVKYEFLFRLKTWHLSSVSVTVIIALINSTTFVHSWLHLCSLLLKVSVYKIIVIRPCFCLRNGVGGTCCRTGMRTAWNARGKLIILLGRGWLINMTKTD